MCYPSGANQFRSINILYEYGEACISHWLLSFENSVEKIDIDAIYYSDQLERKKYLCKLIAWFE